jgi:hypothetical protein
VAERSTRAAASDGHTDAAAQRRDEARRNALRMTNLRVLPRAVRRALDAAGATAVSMLGYYTGSTLAASYLGSHPDVPVTEV